MKLSVIIPCYNEKDTIDTIIRAVRACPVHDAEIVVVDDCSTDGSKKLLKGHVGQLADMVIFHEANQGKGASLRTGITAATGDIVIVQNADLEYSAEEYPILLELIVSGKADAVFGSCFMGGRPHRVVYFWHMVANRFLTLLSNMFTNLSLTDMQTCYEATRAPIAKSMLIEENRFGFEPQITAKLHKLRCRIYEAGIPYRARTYDEGKTISWRDGFRAVCGILKYNARRWTR